MTRILDINVLQEPFDQGLDTNERAQCGFNILAMKGTVTDTWLEEVTAILVGGGVALSSIYVSTKAPSPSEPTATFLTIVETAGLSGGRIHNQIAPAYPRPAARIVAHAPTYATARTLARLAYSALAGVRNATVTP